MRATQQLSCCRRPAPADRAQNARRQSSRLCIRLRCAHPHLCPGWPNDAGVEERSFFSAAITISGGGDIDGSVADHQLGTQACRRHSPLLRHCVLPVDHPSIGFSSVRFLFIINFCMIVEDVKESPFIFLNEFFMHI